MFPKLFGEASLLQEGTGFKPVSALFFAGALNPSETLSVSAG
jgi:hypothetical protein